MCLKSGHLCFAFRVYVLRYGNEYLHGAFVFLEQYLEQIKMLSTISQFFYIPIAMMVF